MENITNEQTKHSIELSVVKRCKEMNKNTGWGLDDMSHSLLRKKNSLLWLRCSWVSFTFYRISGFVPLYSMQFYQLFSMPCFVWLVKVVLWILSLMYYCHTIYISYVLLSIYISSASNITSTRKLRNEEKYNVNCNLNYVIVPLWVFSKFNGRFLLSTHLRILDNKESFSFGLF